MFAWLAARETACRGHLGGSDARDWARENPAPRYADALADVCAERRAAAGPDEREHVRTWEPPNLDAWMGVAS